MAVEKIYVASHRGMVGSAFERRLQQGSHTNIITRTRQELDLLDQRAVFDFLQAERPDYIFLVAAKMGGIQPNNSDCADNKLAYSYLLTPRGIEEKTHLTVSFLKYKVAEYEAIRNEIEKLRREAGKEAAA